MISWQAYSYLLLPFTHQGWPGGGCIQKANRPVKGYASGQQREFAHMSDEEQLLVYKTIKENAAKDKVIGGDSTAVAYSTIGGKRIEDIGADFVSILTRITLLHL